jgi:hypothetical protein
MIALLYTVIAATALFAVIFISTYFNALKNKYRVAKSNRLKAISVK